MPPAHDSRGDDVEVVWRGAKRRAPGHLAGAEHRGLERESSLQNCPGLTGLMAGGGLSVMQQRDSTINLSSFPFDNTTRRQLSQRMYEQ
mmetsp:Transcript_114747/g.187058  ORF Transcript_114747/g.187058 Transcript_114747/m.187058 type:complete len:89 (-) Transcript_114747:214-480(-)